VRRPATPVALAWAATLAGVISIVSALTPEFADRTDLVSAVLPRARLYCRKHDGDRKRRNHYVLFWRLAMNLLEKSPSHQLVATDKIGQALARVLLGADPHTRNEEHCEKR